MDNKRLRIIQAMGIVSIPLSIALALVLLRILVK